MFGVEKGVSWIEAGGGFEPGIGSDLVYSYYEAVLAGCVKGNPVVRQSAENGGASTLRCARSMFKEQVLDRAYKDLKLPDLSGFRKGIVSYRLRSDFLIRVQRDAGIQDAADAAEHDEINTTRNYYLAAEMFDPAKLLYNLVVNQNHTIEGKLATIAHELGHLYCGHLGSPNEKWWQARKIPDNINQINPGCRNLVKPKAE